MPADSDEAVARLATALAHPVRVCIVRSFLDLREASPADLVEPCGAKLSAVSLHTRKLAELGVLMELRTEPRRGAVKHVYGMADEVRDPLRAALAALGSASVA